MEETDRWARWLAERRFGGNQQKRERSFAELLHPLRDRVLDAAEPVAGQCVLDVGCGDGLIAFGALERGAGEVVFTDISPHLLRECERLAGEAGVRDRCQFVQAPADDLGAIASGSVDVVTVRSVLIFVQAKPACFREFARVLAPGGRLSIFEPINRFAQVEWTGSRSFGLDLSAVADLAEKIRAVHRVSPDDPMLDFDERDLVRFAEQAGFSPVNLTLNADIRPSRPESWDVFVNSAGNPNLPTLAEAMAEALSDSEQQQLTDYMRPRIESGAGTYRMAHAYLRAIRP
jgi:SAM-dependent methyltransferase